MSSELKSGPSVDDIVCMDCFELVRCGYKWLIGL